MRLKYSLHAKVQLKYRKISLFKIRTTIKSPHNIIPSYKDRKLFQRKFKNKTLEVVIVDEGSIMIVVTAYYLYEN